MVPLPPLTLAVKYTMPPEVPCRVATLLPCRLVSHGPAMKDADIQTHTGVSIRNLERLRLRY